MKWKDVPGYEGYYQVSDEGFVRSVDREVVLKTRYGDPRPCQFKGKVLMPYEEIRSGKIRMIVNLSKQGKTKNHYVHRLVASAFIPNPENKPQINHIDGDPCNNDVSNLEWVTGLENIQHAFANKIIPTQKPVQMLDPTTLEVLKEFESESYACRQMGVTQGKILRSMQRNGTCKGFKWKYKQNV